jgi:hypothetical protein
MRSATLPKTWIFFFILVMILVIASLLQPATKSQEIPAPSQTAEESLPVSREQNAEEMLQNGDHAIYLVDQSSGESVVLVGYAVFAKPGFITVRADENGMPGNIIGVSDVLRGRVEGERVKITDKLQADHVYYAELVSDDGDGIFDETKDLSVNDKEKSVVLMSFLAKPHGVSTAP